MSEFMELRTSTISMDNAMSSWLAGALAVEAMKYISARAEICRRGDEAIFAADIV